MECRLPLWAEGDMQSCDMKHLCEVAMGIALQTLLPYFPGDSWEDRHLDGAWKEALRSSSKRKRE